MDQERRHIWARLGADIALTEHEMDILLGNAEYENNTKAQIILRALREGRIELCGDCYIPGEMIEDYNKENGTGYEESDCSWYM